MHYSDMEIEFIKYIIKRECKTLSVKRGKRTAYNWIEIRGSGKYGEFTNEEKQTLEKLGLGYGINFANINPESRRYYVEKFSKMFNIDIPEELKKEYVEIDKRKAEREKAEKERQQIIQNCKHEFKEVNNVVVLLPTNAKLLKCVKCGYEKVMA